MNTESWGMMGFLITTIIFAVTTLIYSRKLYRLKRLKNQLQEKANQSHPHDYERQYKK
jgi:hypothetical protein